MRFIEITGKRYGRLTVAWPAGRGTRGDSAVQKKFPPMHWLCFCDCGKFIITTSANLMSGGTQSCGCRHKEMAGARLRTHGKTGTCEQFMWQSAKGRAKEKGLPFDLEINDIVVPERCPLLEITLSQGPDGKLHDSSPTLDRIKAEDGYVKGNIWVISYKANRAKNNLSFEEMKLLIQNWGKQIGG